MARANGEDELSELLASIVRLRGGDHAGSVDREPLDIRSRLDQERYDLMYGIRARIEALSRASYLGAEEILGLAGCVQPIERDVWNVSAAKLRYVSDLLKFADEFVTQTMADAGRFGTTGERAAREAMVLAFEAAQRAGRPASEEQLTDVLGGLVRAGIPRLVAEDRLGSARQQMLRWFATRTTEPSNDHDEPATVDLVLRVRGPESDFLALESLASPFQRLLGPKQEPYALLHSLKPTPPASGRVRDFGSGLSERLDRGAHALEDLLATHGAREHEFQRLLTRFPELLSGLEYSEAIPHVVLESDEGKLIPDFVLRGIGPDPLCDLVELKLPAVSLLTLKGGRPQLTREAQAGITQLYAYAEALERPVVRDRVQHDYGLGFFRPRLYLVIGRSVRFDREDLVRASGPDGGGRLEVLTWDDIVARAKFRSNASG